MELDTSGFATQGPTVFAGNIGDNKYIIQVSPMGIRLLEGGRKNVAILHGAKFQIQRNQNNHVLVLVCSQ